MAYANESDPSEPFKLAEHWPTSGSDHFGGAGLHGSARSWLRLLRALLRGGELDGARILSRASVDAMFSDQLTNEGQRKTCPDFAQIGFPVPARNETSLKGLTFGFGGALNATRLETGRAPGTLVWRGMAVRALSGLPRPPPDSFPASPHTGLTGGQRLRGRTRPGSSTGRTTSPSWSFPTCCPGPSRISRMRGLPQRLRSTRL